jgi:uncharacterized protein (TIGR02145 family)
LHRWGLTPTNETGFSALFAGSRGIDTENFSGLSGSTYFWSSTEISSNHAYGMRLYYSYSDVHSYGGRKHYGFSVRCLKD